MTSLGSFFFPETFTFPFYWEGGTSQIQIHSGKLSRLEHVPFEDVFPMEHGNIPLLS